MLFLVEMAWGFFVTPFFANDGTGGNAQPSGQGQVCRPGQAYQRPNRTSWEQPHSGGEGGRLRGCSDDSPLVEMRMKAKEGERQCRAQNEPEIGTEVCRWKMILGWAQI